jgi:O-antigen ligase
MESDVIQNTYTCAPVGRVSEKIMTWPVVLLAIYLLVEYGRPQFLAPIKPGLLVQGLLLLCLLPYGTVISKVLQGKFFRLYLFMLLFMTLHVFIATNNFYALMGLKVMVSYLIVGVSCCVFIDSINKLKAFFSIFTLVVALCAVNRISGINFLGISGGGYFGDENDFALMMNVALPISFFLGRTQKGWKRWFFWLAAISFIFGNMASASRGGFIGLVAVGTVCWLSSKHRLRAIPVLVVLAILAWNFAPPLSKEKIQGLGLNSAEKDTGKDRIELWKVGWKTFADNPVLGVGQGNIPVVMNKYRFDKSGESFWKHDMWGRMTHSVYLTLLPELGLIGTIVFILILKELYVRKKKINEYCTRITNREEATGIENLNRALQVSLFGFLITGIFLSVLYYPPFWNMSALLVTLSLISSRIQGLQQGQTTGCPVRTRML